MSAKRYSVMFRALHNSSYLTEIIHKSCFPIWRTLHLTIIFRAFYKRHYFSHKIGVDVEKKVYLFGVIYAQNRPYIITIMTKIKMENAKKIADISEKVYNYVKNIESK